MTEVQDPFGGDYTKLMASYMALNAKLGEQGNQIGTLTNQINTLKSTPPTNPSPPVVQPSGSLYDWSNGQMRDDSGGVPPSLYSSMERAGATKEQVDALVTTVETAQRVVESRKSEVIANTVGSQENLTSLMEWASQNNTSPKVRAASNLLGDIDTLSVGLDMLKSTAAESGFSVGTTEPTNTPATNEPTPLPPSSGNINPTLTPLIPNSHEALKAVRDPQYTTSSQYREEVSKRLQLGMQ